MIEQKRQSAYRDGRRKDPYWWEQAIATLPYRALVSERDHIEDYLDRGLYPPAGQAMARLDLAAINAEINRRKSTLDIPRTSEPAPVRQREMAL